MELYFQILLLKKPIVKYKQTQILMINIIKILLN